MNDVPTSPRPPVTVIGLGLMGSALAGAFLRAGHPTTVWNRSAGKADALVARGASRAASVGAAVTAGPLVVVCVRDYDAVYELLGPVASTLSGRTLVNLTSGSSEHGRAMLDWAEGHGARYLDGAIMMTPDGIGDPDTVILYGGSRDVFAAHEPALRALAGATTHLDADTGIPSLYDAALLGIMWATLNGYLHALALVGSEGIAARTFLPHAVGIVNTVGSFLPAMAEQVDERRYTADDATLETHLAAAEHLVAESAARGIDVELPAYTRGLVDRAVAAGHGTDGYERLIEHFRQARQGASVT